MWGWIKFPKIGALVAFFLPWLTVSCSGMPVVKATGWQLAFGGYGIAGPRGTQTVHEINLWLILAILVIAAGIWRTLAKQSKQGSLKVTATSVAALILIWIGTSRYDKSALLTEASKRANGGVSAPIDQSAAMMIQFTWESGYWLAILALIGTACMAWLCYSGKDAVMLESVRNAANAATSDSSRAEETADVASTLEPESQAQTVQSRTCPQCGKRYTGDARFCSGDGVALV